MGCPHAPSFLYIEVGARLARAGEAETAPFNAQSLQAEGAKLRRHGYQRVIVEAAPQK
jgi:hypothetical protein